MLLYGLMMGACGHIGSTLNFMPGLYLKMHEFYHAVQCEQARELQLEGNQVIAIMMNVGFDCG